MSFRELLDVPYADSTDPDQTLDAYLVERPDAPVLVHVHGGGFYTGAKSGAHHGRAWFLRRDWIFGHALSARISVISINYRRTDSHAYPAAAEDLARAIQFTRHNAAAWGIDPSRLALLGISAGGNMSVRVAFAADRADPSCDDPVARQSTHPSLVVVMHAPCDMRRFDREWVARNDEANRMALEHLGRCKVEDYLRTQESRRLVRMASPIDDVHATRLPFLLVYYDPSGRPAGPMPEHVNDPHSAWYGVQLAEALDRVGVDNELSVLTEDVWELEATSVMEFLRHHFRLGDSH